jgi:hypothetical protein
MNAQIRRQFQCRLARQMVCRPRWHDATVVAAALSVLMIGTGPGLAHLATADAAIVGWCPNSLRPADVWNTLTVDMNVKRQRVKSTGEITGAPSPAAFYRIERSSRTGGWKTVITVLSVDRSPVYSLSGAVTAPGPFPVARIEDDEDGTPIRAYNASGALVTPTAFTGTTNATSTPRTVGQQWLDAFVAPPGKKTARQQAFEKLFGKATKAGTLNRYLRTETNGSEEVLVDPKVVVPVEANAVRSGKLVGHRTFTYGPAPDSALVRTAVHAETVTAVDTGDRAVVDTTFSNVCLERK